MYKTDVFISAEEIKEIVGISKSKAYSLIQELNAELKGKRCRKLKRGFLTKKEAQNWENHFKLQKANSLDMTFDDFFGIYEADVKPKIRYNTWCTKDHIIKTKILPYFKDLSMRDITPRDIIKRQNIMRESINNKGKEYTGTYLKTVQAQLSSIFTGNLTICRPKKSSSKGNTSIKLKNVEIVSYNVIRYHRKKVADYLKSLGKRIPIEDFSGRHAVEFFEAQWNELVEKYLF